MATGLKHIEDSQLHESALSLFSNSLSIGPLNIDYSVDTRISQVTCLVYLTGIRIGGGTVNPSRPCIKPGGGIEGFKVELEICLDTKKKQVTYEIEICVPRLPCEHYKGILFSW